MADENETYIASIKPFWLKGYDPILKEVTEKLNKEHNLTIDGLINYLIKDDGTFNKEEKEIMNYIKSDMQKCEEYGGFKFNLYTRALDNFGEYIRVPSDSYEGIIELINITEIAKKYFEPRKVDDISYKGLDMEVYFRPVCSC